MTTVNIYVMVVSKICNINLAIAMKKILVITDNQTGDTNAIKLAFSLAKKMQASIVLAHAARPAHSFTEKVIAGNACNKPEEPVMPGPAAYLNLLGEGSSGIDTSLIEVSSLAMDENQLVQMINQQNIWMIIKSTDEQTPVNAASSLNMNSILNKVRCPLLLIPECWSLSNISRLVYMADLRYCRLDIVRYLVELAKALQAGLSITHLTKNGLVHMTENYANQYFNDEIRKMVNYNRLFFNYTRERDLKTAADVLINGMHHDLLVMAKNRYHFNELVGPYVTRTLPSHITVPLLIFPS